MVTITGINRARAALAALAVAGLGLAGCGPSAGAGPVAASVAASTATDPPATTTTIPGPPLTSLAAEKRIEATITSSMGPHAGCWDPTPRGGNVWGAYQQVFYTIGASRGTGARAARCVGGTISVLDLQWFHTSTLAFAAGRGGSANLAVYQDGVLVVTEDQSATLELERAVARLPAAVPGLVTLIAPAA